MSQDPPEFDFNRGKQEGDEGMDRASEAGRVQAWKHWADKWLAIQPDGKLFTPDDLIEGVGLPDPGAGANKQNAVGAWFNAKAKQHLIEFTGNLHKSIRVDRHTGLHRIWRKL